MYLPRRLRGTDGFEDLDDDPEADVDTFRELLLAALAEDAEVQAAIRRLSAVAKVPEPRKSRRR